MQINEKAKDSPQIEKARRKMQERLSNEQRLVTPEALKKVGAAIKNQIARNASERISLKDRGITAEFDNNAHSAQASRYVHSQFKTLKATSEKHKPSLEGRNVKNESAPTA